MIVDLIDEVMSRLRETRPVFYNEADFQHALAWELHLLEPEARVRLEVPLRDTSKERIDMYVVARGARIAIELKYPRTRFRAGVIGEPVRYTRGSSDAEDETRYFIVSDIQRVEQFVAEGNADVGCVVVLTNISSMWRTPFRATAALDAAFRIHEGTVLDGERLWGDGDRASRRPLELAGRYVCAWRDYSTLAQAEGSVTFRYLLLAVQPD